MDTEALFRKLKSELHRATRASPKTLSVEEVVRVSSAPVDSSSLPVVLLLCEKEVERSVKLEDGAYFSSVMHCLCSSGLLQKTVEHLKDTRDRESILKVLLLLAQSLRQSLPPNFDPAELITPLASISVCVNSPSFADDRIALLGVVTAMLHAFPDKPREERMIKAPLSTRLLEQILPLIHTSVIMGSIALRALLEKSHSVDVAAVTAAVAPLGCFLTGDADPVVGAVRGLVAYLCHEWPAVVLDSDVVAGVVELFGTKDIIHQYWAGSCLLTLMSKPDGIDRAVEKGLLAKLQAVLNESRPDHAHAMLLKLATGIQIDKLGELEGCVNQLPSKIQRMTESLRTIGDIETTFVRRNNNENTDPMSRDIQSRNFVNKMKKLSSTAKDMGDIAASAGDCERSNTNTLPEPLASATGSVGECIICCVNEKEFAMVPCGHLVLCEDCLPQWRAKNNRSECMICKQPVTEAMKIYK